MFLWYNRGVCIYNLWKAVRALGRIVLDILQLCAFLTQKRSAGMDCSAEEAQLKRLCAHAVANHILPEATDHRKMADILLPVVLGGEGDVAPEVATYLALLIGPKEVERKIRQSGKQVVEATS